jgi:hypothetical protein
MYHAPASRLVGRRDLHFLQCLLPVGAICISLGDPAPLRFVLGRQGRFEIEPTELAVAGAYLTYVYCFARAYALQFVGGGAMAVLAFFFGPSSQQVGDWFCRTWNWASGAVWSVIPKTAIGAGIMAITAAFGFLGLGAAVSLRKRAPVLPLEPPNNSESEGTVE